MKKPLKIEELNKIFQDAETADSELFSEQRSNVLLITGDHYARKNNKYWANIRDSRDLNQEQKLRLTMNHIQRITKIYENSIIANSPGVTITPKNEKEMQDVKSAELNEAVWKDIKDRHKFRQKIRNWIKDYVGIGEVAVKIFWNPHAGKFLGWKPAIDEETGMPLPGEDGQGVASDEPVFSGDIEFERIWGFNLLRDPTAKSEEENKLWIVRKMVDIEKLKAMVGKDPEKLKYIEACKDETYIVFDGNKKGYTDTKDQVLLREFFWKPCVDYPMGYYAITTKAGILFEGELPGGIYPIVYTGMDGMQTSPRHQSIVKVLRPYQAELNRTASKIAETQVTSDDKLLVQSGTKVTNGGQLPGLRYFQFTGMQPGILPGRAGDQYFQYYDSKAQEMYQAANVELVQEDKAQQDPFASLFSAMRQKKKFVLYAEDIEDFLADVCETSLKVCKLFMPEDSIVPAIGRDELVNISEFKNTDDLCYQIKIEPMGDDIESMMGRQLTINHALQYVGTQMDKKDIGNMIRAMPFGNFEKAFQDFTLDQDAVENLLLALDRGEQVQADPADDEQYVIKRLMHRIRMADFKQLDPMIQQNYMMVKGQYEQIAVQKAQALQAAEAGFIPSGGTKVKADMYIDGKDGKVERATFPVEALDWLMKRLAEQGSSQEAMAKQNSGAAAEMATMLNQANAQPQMPQPEQGM